MALFTLVEVVDLEKNQINLYHFRNLEDTENLFRRLMLEFCEDFTEEFIENELKDWYYHHEDYHLSIQENT